MEKPRVVIAEDDLTYIGPLQSRFIYEFFDDIQLEVITDESYFEEMFQSLQKMDVLILNDKFYREDFEKHEIKNIFVLTETQDAGEEKAEHINTLYKYTNVKGIFLEIVGKSGLKIPTQNETKDPEIILVTAASGGTGKTTVALGVAAALSDMYKRVLYIEASCLNTFQYYLKNQEPITRQEIYTRLFHAGPNIYQEIKIELRKEKFTYMPPLKGALMAYGINDISLYGKIAMSAKASGEFDYIIIDADSIFDNSKADMMNIADKVIFVIEHTPQAAYAANILVNNISNIDAGKYLFICNKYTKRKKDTFLIQGSNNFKIDEYVDVFEDYNNMSCEDFAKVEMIRKIAFLLI